MREDSAKADLFKLMMKDLSLGQVIRQHGTPRAMALPESTAVAAKAGHKVAEAALTIALVASPGAHRVVRRVAVAPTARHASKVSPNAICHKLD